MTVVAGCVDLKARPDPTRFYTLSAPEALPDSGSGSLAVGIQRIDLPEYLHSKQITTRRGSAEMVRADFHRWADGFEASLKQAIGEQVARQSSVGSVKVYPWAGSPSFDATVTIQLHRFEGADDGNVRLAASWRVNRGSATGPIHETRLTGAWTPGDYQSLVTRMRDLVAQWATEIGDAL
jgi:uncharacterized lipoprotein YmbA